MRTARRTVAAAPLATFLVAALASFPTAAIPTAAADPPALILATTTSTEDSGLLDELVPIFERQAGFRVKTIAVGSGQAMRMGERGEADVLLVHSPEAERKFMEGGFGSERRLVMHNDFLVVGPAADPAGVRGMRNAAAAFEKVAGAGALFLSRGDNSGTHAKERKIWSASGVDPEGAPWYQQTGLGMGQTLRVASEKDGYTLADRGTYMSQSRNLALEILVEGDAALMNVYHVIPVSHARWRRVNAAGARAFADFLVGAEAQLIIGGFGSERYGSPLFFADAGKDEEGLGR